MQSLRISLFGNWSQRNLGLPCVCACVCILCYSLLAACTFRPHSHCCCSPSLFASNGDGKNKQEFSMCECLCCNQNHNSRTSCVEIRAYVNWIARVHVWRDRRAREHTRDGQTGKRDNGIAHQRCRHNFWMFLHMPRLCPVPENLWPNKSTHACAPFT